MKNVFLSRADLDTFSVPKNRLEPQYSDVYGAWKAKNDEGTREKLLSAISPFIEKNIRGIPGGDPNYLSIQGKILAMKAIDKYDPEQSALETYLNHQLMPLRRTSRQQMNMLGLPDRLLLASRDVENAEVELSDELGRMPTTTELADRLSMSTKQIERIRRMAHARNTGSQLMPDEEGQTGGSEAIMRQLPDEYRHMFVMSALRNDPKSALIYEHDQQLHGRQHLSTAQLAEKLGLSPGAISQRRNRIDVIRNNAEREIYGSNSKSAQYDVSENGGIIWHKDPDEFAELFDSSPTQSLTTSEDGRVFSVHDLVTRFEDRPARSLNQHLERRMEKRLSHPFWNSKSGNRISPEQVLDDFDNPEYEEHKRRIENADTSFPVLIAEGKDVPIIDGAHRIAKYFQQKRKGETPSLSFRRIAATEKQMAPALVAEPAEANRRIITDILARLWQKSEK